MMKNDSTRYFAVLKELKNKKEKRGIIVKDKKGNCDNRRKLKSSLPISNKC